MNAVVHLVYNRKGLEHMPYLRLADVPQPRPLLKGEFSVAQYSDSQKEPEIQIFM